MSTMRPTTDVHDDGTVTRRGRRRPVGTICGNYSRWANPVLTPDQAARLKDVFDPTTL